jgi:2,5-furandicarboxylate decarboxylase 1
MKYKKAQQCLKSQSVMSYKAVQGLPPYKTKLPRVRGMFSGLSKGVFQIGEWHTLYGEPKNYSIVTITTVTMWQSPLYYDLCSGHTEHQLLGGLPRLGQIYYQVKAACPGVWDVYMPPSGFCRAACYVAIKKFVEGEAANGAAAVFSADPFVRHAIFVDEDVDIFNDAEVLKAVNLNMELSKCFVIPNAKGSPIDPTSRNGVVTKIAIDATRALDSKFKRINFNEGLDEIDLTKFFK